VPKHRRPTTAPRLALALLALWPAIAIARLAPTAAAQVPHAHAAIAAQLDGSPRTRVYVVDVESGAMRAVGRFSSDHLEPLEVLVDPINRDLILALAHGGGTRFVRLGLSGLSVVRERPLADVSGRATGMTVGHTGDVFAIFGGPSGQLVRIPRNGGSAVQLAALPRATAITKLSHLNPVAIIVQSGGEAPAEDPRLVVFDLTSGPLAVSVWPGYTRSPVTGVVDLATATPAQYITHADGTVGWSRNFQTPTPQLLVPPLPPGGAAAAHVDATNSNTYFLGDARHPHLVTVGLPGAAQHPNPVAGPLPGSPVDFAFAHPARGVVHFFGDACGEVPPPQIAVVGQQVPPNPNFGFQLFNAGATRFAVLLLGASEQESVGLPLPQRMPSGCSVLVSLEIVRPHITSATGSAFQPAPIPNVPSLVGQSIYAQWLVAARVPHAATQAVAVQLGL
jgi:hypothetical protein